MTFFEKFQKSKWIDLEDEKSDGSLFFFLERYVLKPLGKKYLVIETLLGNIFSIAITFLLHFLHGTFSHLPGQRDLPVVLEVKTWIFVNPDTITNKFL